MHFHYDCGENSRHQHERSAASALGRAASNLTSARFTRTGRPAATRGLFEGGELQLEPLKLIADEPRHRYEPSKRSRI